MTTMTISPEHIDVVRRIRNARRVAGLTQEDMARALDITVRTYSRWEAGGSLGFLERMEEIATLVNAPPEQLLGRLAEDRMARMEADLDEIRSMLQGIRDLLSGD